MLALWTRATRNPGSCRCVACISNTTAVSRRAGRLNLPGFAAFGTPTSTFWYTAIFAAGLTIDAKAKKSRNEQWDAAFAHLREEIGRPFKDEARLEQGIIEAGGVDTQDCTPIEELSSESVDWNSVHHVSGIDLVEEDPLDIDNIALGFGGITEGVWNLLAWDSRLPGTQVPEWPVNTGRDLIRHNLPPQSIWALDHVRLTALRRRQTWKKLAMQELSTAMLIYSLIDIANLRGPNEYWKQSNKDYLHLAPGIHEVASLDKAQITESRKEILRHLEELHLRDADIPPEENYNTSIRSSIPAIPHYFQDADGDFRHTCEEMNITIRSLLRRDYKKGRKIAKICHNLLVSSAAPDLQTFNTLLSGFKKWRRPDLVDALIPALEGCKIRPNELTCTAILGHYISEGRPEEFSRFVGKMRGVEGALMLARPDVNINEASQGRLIREKRNCKVFQQVYPTPLVFNVLLGGALEFAGFERALEIYYEMKADGWGLDVFGLAHFLNDCVKRADWYGGLYIWEEINNLKEGAKPRHMAKAYTEMLSLCVVSGNTSAFNQILKEIITRGFDQKAILRAAAETTHRANKNSEWDGITPIAPAFAADNLLIAVSDYITDAKPLREASSGSDLSTIGRVPSNSPSPEEADSFWPKRSKIQKNKPDEQVTKDPDELWAAWLEHELGGRHRDPSA